MGMHRKSAVAAGVALLFGVGTVGGLAAANGNRTNLRADLSGANEVPPADPDGNGRARVELKVERRRGLLLDPVRRHGDTEPRPHPRRPGAGPRRDRRPAVRAGSAPADPRNDELESRRRIEGCVAAAPALLDRSPPTRRATTSTCTTPASPPGRSEGSSTRLWRGRAARERAGLARQSGERGRHVGHRHVAEQDVSPHLSAQRQRRGHLGLQRRGSLERLGGTDVVTGLGGDERQEAVGEPGTSMPHPVTSIWPANGRSAVATSGGTDVPVSTQASVIAAS